jgi:S-DNA-T family DNA segregation ATPase FtsK/SpoIIIE
MVELSIYRRIEKHYLAKLPGEDNPIITDVSKVVPVMNSLCIEMDNRYSLLTQASVRNITEYNDKFISRKLNPNKGHYFMPYIVVIIDEFADIIVQEGKQVEAPISRLAAKARAIGIHLIVATQRPSTDVITGVIKANFPTRIAFKVTNGHDSKTILDTMGANQLIGRGDMLISDTGKITRVQCAFVDTPEVELLVDHISAQQGYPHALELPEPEVAEGGGGSGAGLDANEKDDLFEEAARIVVRHQQGSTSLIQRKMSIGYNRAGRIIDQLEAAGIVGPYEGSKARQVFYPDEYSLEQYLNSLSQK